MLNLNRPAEGSSAAQRTSACGRARVLIVDDERAVQRLVQRALEAVGYETTVASSGSEALAQVNSVDPPDLLFTDVMMPGMNGDELARRLRRDTPDLKVLYYTGCSDRLFERRAMLWADEAFLDKPAGLAGIGEAVSLALYGSVRGPQLQNGRTRP